MVLISIGSTQVGRQFSTFEMGPLLLTTFKCYFALHCHCFFAMQMTDRTVQATGLALVTCQMQKCLVRTILLCHSLSASDSLSLLCVCVCVCVSLARSLACSLFVWLSVLNTDTAKRR